MNGPFDCPWCHRRTFFVKRRESIIIAYCAFEKLCEVLPFHPTFEPVDYYCMVYDNVTKGKIPKFVFEKLSQDTLRSLKRRTTLGEIVVYSLQR